MTVYKFDTVVSDDGMIKIPDGKRFAHRRVEVVVLPKPDAPSRETQALQPVVRFLANWRGALKDVNPDTMKTEYLQDKHR